MKRLLFIAILFSVISLANAQTNPVNPSSTDTKQKQSEKPELCPRVTRQISAEEMQTFPAGKVIDGFSASLRGDLQAQRGQPMPMRFLRINMTDKKMFYNGDDGIGLFHVRVKDAQGHALSLTQAGKDSLGYDTAGFVELVTLKPGEGREFTFDLSKFFDFKEAGDYTVQAFQMLSEPNIADSDNPKRVELLSNKLVISVR